MEPKEYDIQFPRGDMCPLVFNLVDENGKDLKVKQGDELYFTMKKSYNTKEYIIQKRFSAGHIVEQEGKYVLRLLPNETSNLKYGSYVYDICFKSGDLVKTLCLGQVTLTNEATFSANE